MDIKEVWKIERKTGRTWETTYETHDSKVIYKQLATDLIYNKLCKTPYIKRIRDKNNCNGSRTIIVMYDNDVRSTFIIQW